MSEQELRCEEVIERLFEFLDDELDAHSSACIERHLQRCRDCFSRAEFERRLRAKISEAAADRAPQRLRRRVQTILDRY